MGAALAECAQARHLKKLFENRKENGSGMIDHISSKFINGPCLGWGLRGRVCPSQKSEKVVQIWGKLVLASLLTYS